MIVSIRHIVFGLTGFSMIAALGCGKKKSSAPEAAPTAAAPTVGQSVPAGSVLTSNILPGMIALGFAGTASTSLGLDDASGSTDLLAIQADGTSSSMLSANVERILDLQQTASGFIVLIKIKNDVQTQSLFFNNDGSDAVQAPIEIYTGEWNSKIYYQDGTVFDVKTHAVSKLSWPAAAGKFDVVSMSRGVLMLNANDQNCTLFDTVSSTYTALSCVGETWNSLSDTKLMMHGSTQEGSDLIDLASGSKTTVPVFAPDLKTPTFVHLDNENSVVMIGNRCPESDGSDAVNTNVCKIKDDGTVSFISELTMDATNDTILQADTSLVLKGSSSVSLIAPAAASLSLDDAGLTTTPGYTTTTILDGLAISDIKTVGSKVYYSASDKTGAAKTGILDLATMKTQDFAVGTKLSQILPIKK